MIAQIVIACRIYQRVMRKFSKKKVNKINNSCNYINVYILQYYEFIITYIINL